MLVTNYLKKFFTVELKGHLVPFSLIVRLEKTQYKALISDIDGTLGPVSLRPIPSPIVTQAIKAAIQQGFLFTIATGKPFSLVEYLIDHFELVSPMIVDNGAALYDPVSKKQIVEYVIDVTEAQQILEIVMQHSKEYRVSCNEENHKNILNISKDMKVRKFIILDLLPDQADNIIKVLAEKFKNLHVVKTSSDLGNKYYAVYVSSAEATKKHAVLAFAKLMGISTNEIIGIGDHYNDFPLLMACGFKVAMGNAVPELKEIADYICPPVEGDGLAAVLEKFVLNPIH